MTAAAIQALIDAARTGPSDLVTWAELKAILEGLKDQDAVYTFNSRQGTVLPIEGDYSLNLLSDVIVNTPTTNQVLQYNGTNWVNATAPATTVSSVFGRTGTITAAEGDYSLTQLSDVTISSPTLNQLLVYNGSIWTNTSLSILTTTIYSGDGAISGNRIVQTGTNTLTFQGPSSKNSLVVSAAGRILINTATDSGSYELDINGATRINNIATIGSTTANCSHILSSGSESIAWTASNFGISSAIPIRTVIINANGTYSSLTGTRNTFVGYRAGSNVTTGSNNTFLGNDAGLGVTTGITNLVITAQGATTTGLPATTSNSVTLATEYRLLDASTMPTSNYAFIGGGYDSGTAIRTFYFGQMPFTADAGITNTNIAFHAPSGSGTNIAGSTFTINAGRGTGNATPGDVIIGTSTAGASGTTLQTLTNRVWIKGGTGRVGIGISTPNQELEVNGNITATKVLVNITSVGSSPVRISGLPTSSAGLSAGDVWNDSGTLKIA